MTHQEYKDIVEWDLFRGNKVSLVTRINVKYIKPGTNCVYLARKMWYLNSHGKFSRFCARRLQNRIIKKYNCYFSLYSTIGKGLFIIHPIGIVTGFCEIGEDFSIYQNCTIGGKNVGDGSHRKGPVLGNNVCVFAGSILLGDIHVCSDVTVGANSLVIKNIDEPGVYAGSPVRKISDKITRFSFQK